MEKIGTLFSFIQSNEYERIKSERALLIYDLMNGINRTRPCIYEKNGKKKTLGKITARAVAIKVGHLKENKDLRFLLDRCNNANNFSSMFFFSLK